MTDTLNTFHMQKIEDFFFSPERTEKFISRGLSQETWSFDIEDFMEMLHRLMNVAWKRSDGQPWGTFSYEEPKSAVPTNDSRMSLKGEGVFPWITFDVQHRMPSKSHKGLKPREFERLIPEDQPDDAIRVYRQWYDCRVEFAVFAPTNREAIDMLTRLEALLHQYTGLLKEMGISDIIFEEEVGSKNSSASSWSKDIPHRTATYYVRIERIVAVKESTLRAVEMEIRAKHLQSDGESSEETLYYSGSTYHPSNPEDDEFLKLYRENYPIHSDEEET